MTNIWKVSSCGLSRIMLLCPCFLIAIFFLVSCSLKVTMQLRDDFELLVVLLVPFQCGDCRIVPSHQFIQCWRSSPWLCSRQASSLSTEPHPHSTCLSSWAGLENRLGLSWNGFSGTQGLCVLCYFLPLSYLFPGCLGSSFSRLSVRALVFTLSSLILGASLHRNFRYFDELVSPCCSFSFHLPVVTDVDTCLCVD